MAYTTERNNQIVIALLKYHNVKKVVVSPGATNVSIVASMQHDPFFELYSCVDERSAAYMACGMAAESGEIVAISCTGATASRNYFPGLTEAYYRKLPILVITSTMPIDRIGHNVPQVIDRSAVVKDAIKNSYYVPLVKDDEDEWSCSVKVNEAILEIRHHGNGPVHLNVETTQGGTFDCKLIPDVIPIDRVTLKDNMPQVNGIKNAIFVGAHLSWNDSLVSDMDKFCEMYNCVVIGDLTSNYKGKYFVPASLITHQKYNRAQCINIDLLIHMGDTSGAYINFNAKEVWRVCSDGKVCDTYRKLRYVFEMDESEFFERYTKSDKEKKNISFYTEWRSEYDKLQSRIEKIPFSNIYVASVLSKKIPAESVLHLGILNSLRSWNFFEIDKSINVYCNTGGFGIDGCISTLIGASIVSPEKLFFGVVGDLAFFYDMNSIGNRHLRNNIRLIVINNGHGQEFCNPGHRAAQFGEDTESYIAAAGHYANQSAILIKSYSESLGFEYHCADNINEFNELVPKITARESNKPMIIEVFTTKENEGIALQKITTLDMGMEQKGKKLIKSLISRKS